MSTENRLAEIREREKAACPGPWLVSWCQVPKYPDGRDVYFFGIRDNHGTLADPDEHGFVDPDGSGTDDNWLFLQHVREDSPYLLSEIDRLTAERDALREALVKLEADHAYNLTGKPDAMVRGCEFCYEWEEIAGTLTHAADCRFAVLNKEATDAPGV